MWLEQGSVLSGYAWELARVLLALLALAGIIWLASRAGPLRALLGLHKHKGPLELVQCLPLGPRRALYVVRASGRTLLLGAAEGGPLTLIAELEPSATLQPEPTLEPGRSAP